MEAVSVNMLIRREKKAMKMEKGLNGDIGNSWVGSASVRGRAVADFCRFMRIVLLRDER